MLEELALGTALNPSDARKGRRKIVEEFARDLDPAQRDALLTMLESWHGESSEAELRRLIGDQRSRKLLKRLNPA